MPDWKEICAKCQDGEIEPKECEYYGEPNGCNSPTIGKHPPDASRLMRAVMSRAPSALRAHLDALGADLDVAKARLVAVRRMADEAATSIRVLSAAIEDARKNLNETERRAGG